jgi:hypothetical protein
MKKPKAIFELTRRDLLGALAAAAAGVTVAVIARRPECPKLSDRRGTRWIGHL